MVQDLDPFLGITADREVINEQQLDPCIVPDPLTVLIQIFLPVENNQLVQQVAIVYKLTVKIAVLAHTARSTRAILPKQESHLAGWLNSGWLN